MVSRLAGVLLSLSALVFVPAAARAQDAKSPDLAKQLAQLMDAKKLDAFAAADKDNPGSFIATLYFPGTQLLVVCAKYAAPTMVTDLLAKKDYRSVYVELSSASVPGSKIFVMDTFADGLVPKPAENQPADSVENGKTQATFDGGWKKAKMSEADYMKAFGEADAAYARMLDILIAQLKTSGT
jgi:hypothetical protein